MKNLFFSLIAVGMFSFTEVNNEEAFGNCPIDSTEVVATCTRGCYQINIAGVPSPLNETERRDAEERLQNWCNNNVPKVQTSIDPPPFL